MKDATPIILSFNKGLSPHAQMMKFSAIQESPFRFYRGTCHLFYDRLSAFGRPKDHTEAWICGDLHVENFGSFKGDNRVVYFDLNDFDEAVIAPLSMEVLRFGTAILIAAGLFKYTKTKAKELTLSALKQYSKKIILSKSFMVEHDVAVGLMKTFLDQVAERKREAFIRSITKAKGNKLECVIDNIHRVKMEKEAHAQLMSWCKKEFPKLDMLKDMEVYDCVIRIAGTGSLGCERYAMLAKNKKNGKLYLLDMKEAKPSSLMHHLNTKQPRWANEAERVITVQRRLQYCSPALLTPVYYDRKWFVIKELQPIQDKVDLTLAKGKTDKLGEIILPMADLAAYAHLRGTGRQGSSSADELAEAVSGEKWANKRFALAEELANQTMIDYKDFLKYKIG